MPAHRDLARIAGAEHVLEAPPPGLRYNRDASRRRELEGRADAVVLPGNAQEVAEVVRWCYAHDTPIVARGGGTGLTGGAVPSEGGVVCDHVRAAAPAAGAGGGDPARRVLRTSGEGCQAMLDIPAAGIQASALEFLDGAMLGIVASAYPGHVPADAGFALLVELHEQIKRVFDPKGLFNPGTKLARPVSGS
jgi:FAD/FMN-containing dehydrogenase